VRLVSLNVLHGRKLEGPGMDERRYVDAIAQLDADVIGIQEVDRYQPRSGSSDQALLAAKAVGAKAVRFEPALVGTPGRRWRPATPQDGEDPSDGVPMYGVALASRYPVLAWHRLALPPAPGRWPVLAPGARLPILIPDEPRVALAAVLGVPGGVMTVATTHLSFAPGWNTWQLRRTIRFLRALPAPRILLGDLNMPASAVRYASGWTSLARVATYPSSAPRIQLDHVLGHGGIPDVVSRAAVPLAISDHRALVVDLADRTDALR
jgi:endonuclease/exonuclease/phosphatase family metal-dependent hydrolase